MIDFSAFADELVKIAQPNVQHAMKPGRRKALKAMGAIGGATAGGAGGLALTRAAGPKGRAAGLVGGALLSGLGGERIGGGLHRALG